MKKKRCGKIIRNTVLALFLLCVCAAGALALRGYSLYTSALAAKPVSKAVKEVREQPGFTPLASLPETYPQAVLAVEDHRFPSFMSTAAWTLKPLPGRPSTTYRPCPW